MPTQLRGAVGERLPLSGVPQKGSLSLDAALWRRRSVRDFAHETIHARTIARLLWAAQGITDADEQHRTAPSAGATYPLEVLAATDEILARYVPEEHALEVLQSKDLRSAIASVTVDQKWVKDAPAVFVFAAEESRTARRYGRRATRYVLMEVGCASQNLMLEAAALGLGSCAVGAFDDAKLRRILGVPRSWKPYLVVPVGFPAA
ncbi:MAG: SagB/ThcOx family dehydrogenase [Candidatus Krumholzibacteriia bacterium]